MNCKVRWRDTLRLVSVTAILAALGSSVTASSKEESSPESSAQATNQTGPATQVDGQQLWSANCGRCHNIHPPATYSASQWDIVVHHMRVRANITGEEQRAIVEFLKSAGSSPP